MDKVVVVLPTYNEARNLPLMAAELWALSIPDLTILVVDDDSPDNTGQVAEDLALQHPGKIEVLRKRRRSGYGRALQSGLGWALAAGAEYIVQMDCDFAHSPSYVLEMLEAVEGADLVIGSRFVAGGRTATNWSIFRYMRSWWVNTVFLRGLLGLRVRDVTTGFKCWRADSLRLIDLDAIRSRSFSIQFELAFIAEKMGFRIIEIPIHSEDRQPGESSITLRHVFEAFYRAWDIRFRHNRAVKEWRANAELDEQTQPSSDSSSESAIHPPEDS